VPIVEISNGELADKWTILRIKQESLNDTFQVANARIESDALKAQVEELEKIGGEKIKKIMTDLFNANLVIWDLMEEIYNLKPPFDHRYVNLTLKITQYNQKRAFLKKAIDKISEGKFTEAKSFFENESYIVDID
jgi:hypothetical protein